MRILILLIGLNLLGLSALAHSLKKPTDSKAFGKLEGFIYDQQTKAPISFATIRLLNSSKGNYSDTSGYYLIDQLPIGVYDIEVTFTGYETNHYKQISIEQNKVKKLDFFLETNAVLLTAVTVKPNQTVTKLEQQKLKFHRDFISNVPSGDDIMQIMEIAPGVSSPPGFNNELNIRGGASFENKFSVDGVTIPIINHFASTGTNNGFRSILHHKTIKSATLHTSQFPIQVGGATSGVFDFQLIEGNAKSIKKSFVGSTTDAVMMMEGPLSKDVNFVFSFRQAYLKPTLTLLNRPILSTYNDWLYKVKWKKKNHLLTLLGLGSSDGITENFNAPATTINQYLLARLSTGNLWHTFNALKYQNLRKTGYTTFQLATYFIKSQASKIETNPQALYTNRNSEQQRRQLKLELENVQKWANFDFRSGIQANHMNFSINSSTIWKEQEATLGNMMSDLSFFKWGAFIKINQLIRHRFFWSIGARIDTDSYTEANPLQQFSPRLSLLYRLNQRQSIYANAAQYFQLPPTIALAYRNPDQTLINQTTLSYFSTKQFTLGWKIGNEQKADIWKIELFQKNYGNYPIVVENQIPLSAMGSGLPTYSAIPIATTGKVNTNGLEISWHPLLTKGYYGFLSYTLNNSKFEDKVNGGWRPTNYDARHIFNVAGGRKMKQDWHIGFTLRLQSGIPYTPWDIPTSSQATIWAASLNVGVLDYEAVNVDRTKTNATLDLRIDKRFTFKHVKMKAYLDLLNLPISGKTFGRPLLTTQKDTTGLDLFAPNNPQQIVLQQIDNNLSSMIPSLGVSLDF